MDPAADPTFLTYILLDTIWTSSFILNLGLIIVLLLLSALFSGSEIAFFSITTHQKHELEEADDNQSVRVLHLLEAPDKEIASKKLLATILIANNFVNVAIVLVSTFIAEAVLPELPSPWKAIVQVGVVTFVLVMVGEVIPKVYATTHNLTLAKMMSGPVSFLKRIFGFMSNFLISSTGFIDRRFNNQTESGISVDELEHAVELTKDQQISHEEKKIFEGIVNFGTLDAKQAMTSRVDVFAFEINTSFQDVLSGMLETKFSRIPIYEDSMDQITGVLFVKDLLSHLHADDFDWTQKIRPALFVPEMKKLDDLLREFQEKKNHLAIVVDEYGGTSGLITLEDILEEIVGEITDEFDKEGLNFSKLGESSYLFEGKTPLIDMYRILSINGDVFEESKGEADTLAGFFIELCGRIPVKGEKITFEHYTLEVDAADKRKLKRIKVKIGEELEES